MSTTTLSLSLQLRREIANVRDPRELNRLLNPVIGWSEFAPPTPTEPPKLGGLEGDPTWFFNHTYPSTAIKETISRIKAKLEKRAPGIIPIRGFLGTGKSHLQLTIFHLLINAQQGKRWLERWNIDFEDVPKVKVVPIPLQSKAMRIENLWEPFYSVLGQESKVKSDDWPRGEDVAEAVKEVGSPVVVLIDELDNWYDAKDTQGKARNRGFIQAIAEASAKDDVPLIVIVACLGASGDVELLLKTAARNVGGEMLVLDRIEDILEMVKFRLFDSVDRDAAKAVADSYLKMYRSLELKGVEKLGKDIERHYPFHPSLFRPISTIGARQLLQILARLVINNLNTADLLTVSNIPDDIVNAFIFQIDDGLVSAYFDDMKFISDQDDVRSGIISKDLARAFLLTILLNTFNGGPGASFEELIYGGILKPVSRSEIEQVISFLEKWSRIAPEGGRYKFTVELPPPVRIMRRASSIDPNDAIKRVDETLQRVIEREVSGLRVVYGEDALVDDDRFRIGILKEAPSDTEVLYKSLKYENTVLFLYPTQNLANGQILWTAKQEIASEQLATEDEKKREQYEEFKKEYTNALEKRIKEAEWRLLLWTRTSPREAPTRADVTIQDFKKLVDIVVKYSSRELIEYFVSEIISQEKSSLRDLKARFLKLRGAPLLPDQDEVLETLSEMTYKGDIVIRLPQGKVVYKERIQAQAIVDDSVIEKPEVAQYVSIEEAHKLLSDKGVLSFKDLKQSFPFTEDADIEKVMKQLPERYGGLYVLEEGKVVRAVTDARKAKLYTKTKAAEALEELVVGAINDSIAVRIEDLLSKLSEDHPGVNQELLTEVVDGLEIAGKVNFDRRNSVATVTADKLNEELKQRVRAIVIRKGTLKIDALAEQIVKELPVAKQLIMNAIGFLCDEGVDVECKEGAISKREMGAPPGPKRRVIIKEEGIAKEVAQIISKELEDESLAYAELSIQDLDADRLKGALEALGDTKVNVTARRRS